jgi:NTP pyrophosphatase (non-canonical NTP hydrolase)
MEVLSDEIAPWQDYSFPDWRGKPYRLVLGAIEEFGEMTDACLRNDPKNIQEEMADIVIYLAAYCATKGWRLDVLVGEVKDHPEGYGLTKQYTEWMPVLLATIRQIGKIARAQLKSEQGIKGSPDEHDQITREAIRETLRFLATFCLVRQISFKDAVAAKWRAVRLRDWQSDPLKGTANPSLPWKKNGRAP